MEHSKSRRKREEEEEDREKEEEDSDSPAAPPARRGNRRGNRLEHTPFTLNHELFTVALTALLADEACAFKDILTPHSVWRMHPDFVRKMEEHVVLLCAHYVRRASLFGQYRNDPDMLQHNKRKKPQPMECREADFNLAWQTLEQDSK
jgi:hypothetical protein